MTNAAINNDRLLLVSKGRTLFFFKQNIYAYKLRFRDIANCQTPGQAVRTISRQSAIISKAPFISCK